MRIVFLSVLGLFLNLNPVLAGDEVIEGFEKASNTLESMLIPVGSYFVVKKHLQFDAGAHYMFVNGFLYASIYSDVFKSDVERVIKPGKRFLLTNVFGGGRIKLESVDKKLRLEISQGSTAGTPVTRLAEPYFDVYVPSKQKEGASDPAFKLPEGYVKAPEDFLLEKLPKSSVFIFKRPFQFDSEFERVRFPISVAANASSELRIVYQNKSPSNQARMIPAGTIVILKKVSGPYPTHEESSRTWEYKLEVASTDKSYSFSITLEGEYIKNPTVFEKDLIKATMRNLFSKVLDIYMPPAVEID